MIDAIDVFFRKELVQSAIELLCGRQIVAERLFDDHARVVGAAGFRESFGDCSEQAGRHGQIVQRRLGIAQLLAQLGEGGRIGIVAVDVAQQADELFKGRLLQAAMLFQALLGARFQLIEIPTGLGNADDRER